MDLLQVDKCLVCQIEFDKADIIVTNNNCDCNTKFHKDCYEKYIKYEKENNNNELYCTICRNKSSLISKESIVVIDVNSDYVVVKESNPCVKRIKKFIFINFYPFIIKFVKNIKNFLAQNGDLIIEIEYLQSFIKNLEFERFYFDRPFYYSAFSINKLFNNVGMSLYDIEIIEAHGGSLRCYIKNIKNYKKTNKCNNILNNELKSLSIKSFKMFNNKITKEVENFKYNLINFKKEKKIIIGYGAPARVSTITNFANIDSKLINYIIDDSPLKQNRFSPGKHIKILTKKNNINNKIENVIVFAYEYFEDIKKKFNNLNVSFFKPIPFRKIK